MLAWLGWASLQIEVAALREWGLICPDLASLGPFPRRWNCQLPEFPAEGPRG
jgi:hypothetical protein